MSINNSNKLRKMKRVIFLLLLLLSASFVSAQSNLYMSNEFVKAYKNKTRSKDGKPGKNYFTNYSDYTINANFDPATGKLKGSEKIIYHNRSHDTLSMIVIRLYDNLYKKGEPRDFRVNADDINNGVNVSKLIVNGKKKDVKKLFSYGTNVYLRLKKKINPASIVNLEIEWNVQTPTKGAVRNGKYGENIYFVGYWYPQIAVYDDVFGWDRDMYTGAEEFYNDHSNFDVKLTVKSPNLVWATGMLQNTGQIFTTKYLNLIKKAKISNKVVHIITPKDYKAGNILKNKKENTWHFKASKVPDFAFATSDKHNWDAVSISIPDKAQRVLISGVYMDSSKIYHTLAQTAKKIISYYSFNKPQIFYPYTAMTVFEGGGGMEYPMMVNQGDMEKPCQFYYVTAHEIGHSYFPFFTGTNETKYAWMDEGLMSFFPRLVVDEVFDSCNVEKDIISNYAKIAGTEADLPVMLPSDIFKKFFSYRNIAYNRPAYAFHILRGYIGDSLFFASLREFVHRWHYKHPYPYDFFNTFDQVTKQDLSWIWKPYFFEFVKPDLALTKVKYEGGLYITVENKGGMPQPIKITITLANGKKQIYSKNSDVWKKSNKFDIYIPITIKPKQIKLGDAQIPDVDKQNNLYKF